MLQENGAEVVGTVDSYVRRLSAVPTLRVNFASQTISCPNSRRHAVGAGAACPPFPRGVLRPLPEAPQGVEAGSDLYEAASKSGQELGPPVARYDH